MKILLAAGLFPPDIGGPSRYAQMLVRDLPVHNIEVEVMPFGLVRKYPKIVRHLIYFILLWRKSRTTDLVYALDPMSVGVPACMVAKILRKPFVIRLGGDYVWEQATQRFGVNQTLDEYTYSKKRHNFIIRTLALIQTRVVNSAQAVILPSEYLAKIVETWGVPRNKIKVIYSAHSVVVSGSQKSDIRNDLKVEGLVLLSVARLTPWKGMDTLIKLVSIRIQRGEAMTLLIGGDGPERQKLESLVNELNINEHVRFLGTLPLAQVFDVVKAADIFLLNTAYEGLSHQLIEVMAIGTPIITTPVGGNVELLTDKETALLVPINDVQAFDAAVNVLNQDANLRDSLVLAAKKRAAHFASDDAVLQVASLLKSILSSKSK